MLSSSPQLAKEKWSLQTKGGYNSRPLLNIICKKDIRNFAVNPKFIMLPFIPTTLKRHSGFHIFSALFCYTLPATIYVLPHFFCVRILHSSSSVGKRWGLQAEQSCSWTLSVLKKRPAQRFCQKRWYKCMELRLGADNSTYDLFLVLSGPHGSVSYKKNPKHLIEVCLTKNYVLCKHPRCWRAQRCWHNLWTKLTYGFVFHRLFFFFFASSKWYFQF